MIDMDPCRPRFSPSKSRNSGDELVGKPINLSRRELSVGMESTSIHSTCPDEDVIVVDFTCLQDVKTIGGHAQSRLDMLFW
jgi:hypothetical protein